MTNSFTKYVVLVILNTAESEEVCAVIFQHWISSLGVPKQIHSNGGLCFTSKKESRMFDEYNIIKKKSAPFHPQSNSMFERLFRIVNDMIYCVKGEFNIGWFDSLAKCQWLLEEH